MGIRFLVSALALSIVEMKLEIVPKIPDNITTKVASMVPKGSVQTRPSNCQLCYFAVLKAH